jgi:carboxylesterase type B
MPPPHRAAAALLLLLTAGARARAAPAGASPTVTIPGLGTVQGVANGLAEEYRALPYAAPPARWAAPAPPAAWSPAVLDGTHDPAGCMQMCHEPVGVCPLTTSEDCLYLNVFRPLRGAPAGELLPVLVFIHGGNFRDGFAGGLLYNGTYLAAPINGGRGAIVVAISYRLGVFGFLYGGDAPGAPPGNLGLVDQRAALQWVQTHIAAFGGDAARVTLFGQSAGAMSVASHMISPASRGLFAAAFAMSEPFDLPFRDPQSALAAFEAVTWAAGCAGAASASACLRALPAQALLAAQVAAQANLTDDKTNLLQAFMPFCPTTGTPDVPNWPTYSFQGVPGSAPVADVPFLASTTSSEGSLFIYAAFGANVSALEYAAVLAVFYGANAPRVAAQYPVPVPAPADLRPLTSNVTTDDIFRCATRNATRALAAAPGRTAPVYLARFSELLSWSPALWTNLSVICWTQVCHGADLPFWFTPQDPPRSNWQPDELRLAAAMRAYLVEYATTAGASLGAGLPDAPVAWPPLDAATGAAPQMELGLPAWRVSDEAGTEACALWDAIGYSNDGAWSAAAGA